MFDKFIVKDFVKSVKGFDFPEYLTCDMSDMILNQYISKFKQLRGELYTEGIVLKEFVELDKKNGYTHEFRANCANEELLTIYHNSGNYEGSLPNEFARSRPFTELNSSFYTVDSARTHNGQYIVIETGDGQVSGLPSVKEVETLYQTILKNMTHFVDKVTEKKVCYQFKSIIIIL